MNHMTWPDAVALVGSLASACLAFSYLVYRVTK
jgi:hypothetical protein